MAKNMLTDNLSEPLNGARTAQVEINAGDGNLTIERLANSGQLLASGMLQHFANQGPPTRTLALTNGQAILTLRVGDTGRPWFRFPWTACNGATEWRIHLNPAVLSDITAHSNGGNVKLNLVDMAVTCVAADTGGGNMDVVLPDNVANLSVTAKTGAGNVTVEVGSGMAGSSVVDANSGAGSVVVRVPSDVAARIHAITGLGRATVDPRFTRTDNNTYQSSDFDDAANKVEITVRSGAGNVSVHTK